MDKERTSLGRLGYPQFKDLIVSLKLWQGVFRTHTKEKTGVLRAERLRDALLEVGFRLSGEIMSILCLRYMRKDGTLRFGDFVAIILNLTVAFCKYTASFLLRFLIRADAKISFNPFVIKQMLVSYMSKSNLLNDNLC